MNNDFFKKLAEKYPFITLCVYATTEYVGIIQNQDDDITTIYDFGAIQDIAIKHQFLELPMFGGGKVTVVFLSTYSSKANGT